MRFFQSTSDNNMPYVMGYVASKVVHKAHLSSTCVCNVSLTLQRVVGSLSVQLCLFWGPLKIKSWELSEVADSIMTSLIWILNTFWLHIYLQSNHFFECQPHVKQHVARNKLAIIPVLPSSSSHSQRKTDM